MKRFVAWIAMETDDVVATEKLAEVLLMGPIQDLIDRGFIKRAGVAAREVKDGEEAPTMPPEFRH